MVSMADGRPTCVSWLLLVSHAVLLGIGGLGMWLSIVNFEHEETLPPTPPVITTTTTTTTTTTPGPGRSYYYPRRNNDEEVPQVYKDYVSESERFADLSNEVRFYLAPLSLICVMVAGLTLVGGLFSRQLFSSTFSLYSSLGLWILTLVLTMAYQNVLGWNHSTIVIQTAAWVLGGHILLLLFLLIQMLLCIWELRRQKISWPTINILNVFTMETLFLASRLSLTVFTFTAMRYSQMFQGFPKEQDSRFENYYGRPYFRYPLQFSLLCWAAAFYNAVTTLETTLSSLLGKVHRQMTTLTCLLSGLCCVTIAVFSSPAFVQFVIGPYLFYVETMNFAIGLSVVTLIHWLAYLMMPSTLRTPRIISQIIEAVLQIISSDDVAFSISTRGKKSFELISKNVRNDTHVKAASLIFAIISIPIISVSLENTPSYRSWGHVLVLCANAVTVMRTVPPLVMEHFYGQKESIPLKQKLIVMGIEVPLLLLGGITVSCNSFGLGVFGGLLNIFLALFLAFVMWCRVTEEQPQGQDAEGTKHLTEEEETTSQDDDQDNSTDVMA